jgi:hypothetical protein
MAALSDETRAELAKDLAWGRGRKSLATENTENTDRKLARSANSSSPP